MESASSLHRNVRERRGEMPSMCLEIDGDVWYCGQKPDKQIPQPLHWFVDPPAKEWADPGVDDRNCLQTNSKG